MGASICSSESPWIHVSAALGHLQVSAVALGPDGNLYSLDRAGRRWEQSGAPDVLSSHVIRCWNSCGQEVAAFGADLFVMPHGLTDKHGSHQWISRSPGPSSPALAWS
jgi:peptidylamidoglycolate lyase